MVVFPRYKLSSLVLFCSEIRTQICLALDMSVEKVIENVTVNSSWVISRARPCLVPVRKWFLKAFVCTLQSWIQDHCRHFMRYRPLASWYRDQEVPHVLTYLHHMLCMHRQCCHVMMWDIGSQVAVLSVILHPACVLNSYRLANIPKHIERPDQYSVGWEYHLEVENNTVCHIKHNDYEHFTVLCVHPKDTPRNILDINYTSAAPQRLYSGCNHFLCTLITRIMHYKTSYFPARINTHKAVVLCTHSYKACPQIKHVTLHLARDPEKYAILSPHKKERLLPLNKPQHSL